MSEQEGNRLTGFASQVTSNGIGIEVHYNVEANSRGYNRKMSIGLFATGDRFAVDAASLQANLQEAAVQANDLVFQACNRLENKLRRMNGREILNPSDGTVLGIDAPEPIYWQDPVDFGDTDTAQDPGFDDVPF